MLMQIDKLEDRLTVATILVKNGYKVWTEKTKLGGKTVTLLCAERNGLNEQDHLDRKFDQGS